MAKSRLRAVESQARQAAFEVSRLPQPVMLKMAEPLRAARQELQKDLREILKGDKGDTFTAQRYRNALVQVRSSIAAIEKTEPLFAHALRDGADTSGKLAVKHIEQQLATFSTVYSHSIQPMPLVPASKILGEGFKLDHYNKVARRYTDTAVKDIRRQLAIGMIRGESMYEMTRRLVGPKASVQLGKIEHLPDAAGLISERLFNKFESWSNYIVRTEVMKAYNSTSDETIREVAKIDPAIQRRWDSTLDYRTCVVCRSLHGETKPPGEYFTGGFDGPPAHPNCRCIVTAWRADWAERGLSDT